MFRIISLLVIILPAFGVMADDLNDWLTSEARKMLIEAFEENECRLTLTEVSDILFDYDADEQMIYTERLIRMEPELPGLTFPVVLVKGKACQNTNPVSIVVPEQALDFAVDTLEAEQCAMLVTALESMDYPIKNGDALQAIDKRNIVSELYNRNLVALEFHVENSVEKLRVVLLTGTCA